MFTCSGNRRCRPSRCPRVRPEELLEGAGVGVDVHEDQRPPCADLNREQREVVVAQRTETLARRHLAEPPPEVPRPAVVTASQLASARSPDALAELVAAVSADVLERAQLAVVAAHDEHRRRPDVVLEEVAGRGDVIDAARDLPHPGPERAQLELRPISVTCNASFGTTRRCPPPADARIAEPTVRLIGQLRRRRRCASRRSHQAAGPGAGVGVLAHHDRTSTMVARSRPRAGPAGARRREGRRPSRVAAGAVESRSITFRSALHAGSDHAAVVEAVEAALCRSSSCAPPTRAGGARRACGRAPSASA